MKLASLKHGRDGKLIVVKSDLSKYADATAIAPTLQAALDEWDVCAPQLRALAEALESGKEAGKAYDAAQCASPLPRAYQVADGSAYLSHVRLTRKSRGAEMPPEFEHDPLMYQGVSSTIIGPMEPVPVSSEDFGIDYEAEVAIITDDVPMGVTAEDALDHIALVFLMNDVSLRQLVPAELAKGFGFFQAKPPSSFSPVAVTPDALGKAWQGGKVHLPILSFLNGKAMGHPHAGNGMQFHFGQLIAHAAKTRPLCAGTIIGSGTVSNEDLSVGVSCLIERRMREKLDTGESTTPFLKYGDVVRIEMKDDKGASIFGAIEQKIALYTYRAADNRKKAAS
ncbi:MAG: fumarylacetoacetate hydrolase family protein [Alphaproteobacteria bacterium]|nr:fumarylacetoacetate hydrolase family protein [Alphaproteobacteria bacterium]MBU0858559.1 fumarylacetoacetate hydrolase family protein [Alphaproteobacteria bacterium]